MANAGAGPADEAILLYTTWPDAAVAEAAGRAVVEAGLAACVNVIAGMRSVYRWKGAIETADEAVMIVKTLRSRLEAVTVAVTARHPYETPAIVAIAVAGGSRPYLDWIGVESSRGGGHGDAE